MFNQNLPLAKRDYSESLESFNEELFTVFRQLTVALKPKESLLYAYYEMLLEAQSLGKLAENAKELADGFKYLEAFTVTRSLVERTLNFKAASNFDLQIIFQRASSLNAGCQLVNSSEYYSFHNCATTLSEMEEVCLQLRIPKEAKHRFPMARYYISKNSNLLVHEFPNDYRQVLWSFIEDEAVVANNQWLRRHYTSFDSVVKNLSAIGVLTRSDKAKLLTHYGFLSAIAHSPFGITNELHGQNNQIESFYGPTNRLLNLYLASCQILILDSLLPWMLDYDYFEQEMIDTIEGLLHSRAVILSELGFPFAPDHAFDDWQRSLPKFAANSMHDEKLDLSREYLDPDFLTRILNINTTTTELSIGKTWNPVNLYGIQS